ncbi:MAG TPA: hypothetical protein PLO37_23750 [Candidatus Hydrogenedentes bacterium]|nr:hypothetical protein [Candidatus Hydrogenedentota bacterium]HPG69876.1 hypothetical protein [Candidatus Hydrogenedentota bacterium]
MMMTSLSKRLRIAVRALAWGFLLAGCASNGALRDVAGVLPSPGFGDGWAMDDTIREYGPDTVFDYIDGEAELYFPYGFETLATTTYVHDGNADDAVTADVYAMGSVLDAFGIYSNYRYSGADHVDVATEGFCDGYQLMLYQDRYFVRLSASGKPETNRAPLEACAKAVAARLPGDATPPAELALIGVKGLDPDSVRYVGESLLGYKFFPRGLIGEVARDGATVRAFVVFTDGADCLGQYLAYLKEEGVATSLITLAPGDAVAAKDPLYKGVLVIEKGAYVAGVIGIEDPSQGADSLEELVARLGSQAR